MVPVATVVTVLCAVNLARANIMAAVMPMGRRSSSVWTQQGPKLVGTDAVGQAEQGNSVSHSAESWADLATAGP